MTDEFQVVREAISVYHVASGKKEEAHAALASIEERLRVAEREARRAEALTFAIEKGMVRSPAAEQRVAELEEALREIENAGDRAAVQIARDALATSEQASADRRSREAASPTRGTGSR
jgi:hypothetical protein